jgi:hypothetical protein
LLTTHPINDTQHPTPADFLGGLLARLEKQRGGGR